jgi:GTP-binding protein Era
LKRRAPLILALNKIDLLPPESIPSQVEIFGDLVKGAEVFTLSAMHGDGREALLQALLEKMPVREAEFEAEQTTDFYEREIAAELIRAACLVHLRNEVPHGVNVRMDEFTERGDVGAHIAATIFVERESQKGIVIGEGGLMLKKIGMAARSEIESMSGRKVFLELRVKVEKDWRNDDALLRRFGYKIEQTKKRKKK